MVVCVVCRSSVRMIHILGKEARGHVNRENLSCKRRASIYSPAEQSDGLGKKVN